MFPVEWSCIRPINHSRREGFEELVCQLARYEAVPGGLFRRKGKPDGGVECFWTLTDGSEWGWQAKYFLGAPSSQQWQQVDDSVRRFLHTHPKMSKLTIAMPVDLPDARISGRESAQDKWDKRVRKWKNWAANQGQSVEFEYWGASELVDRLSQDQHRGRALFWFGREFFTQQWFTERIEDSIKDVGPRYTPEIDVTLPVAQVFDGLGRTDAFYSRLKGWVPRIRKSLASVYGTYEPPSEMARSLRELRAGGNALCQTLSGVDEESVAAIDYGSIRDLVQQAEEKRRTCQDAVAEEVKRFPTDARNRSSSTGEPSPVDHLRYLAYDLRRLGSILGELQSYIGGQEASAANAGALLLVGKAGKGKTHLLCDIAQRRNAAKLPTVLLLGGQLAGDPWSAIAKKLDLAGHSRRELLGALEAAAQVCGRRALVLIDALNDSENPRRWRSQLASFLEEFARHEWIGVAISVRSSYEELIVPDHLGPDQLVRVEHHGFAGVEYEAMRCFFDHYGIEQPSAPLLNPEFQTPLFLRILCEGLENQKLTRVPRGLRGITAIFDFFVDSVDKRLQFPHPLDLSPHGREVQRAIHDLTTLMAERTTDWIPSHEAEVVVNGDLPNRGYTDSLFYHLLSEGLLSKERFHAGGGELVEGVTFAYQRLADHLIAQHLLDQYLTDDPTEAFQADAPLGAVVLKRDRWWRPQVAGLIQAFSIQIPERTGREFIRLVPEVAENPFVLEAFVDSVLWRDPQAFSDETLDCVNECTRHAAVDDRFLNVLLTVAVDPGHPYNADFLHHQLSRHEMAERDAWWSIFLHEQYGCQDAVDRLVDWAWASNDKGRIEDESIRLCAVALGWFLTTSHRFLRDRATKALVNLLSDRLHVLRAVLEQFEAVNDPYVLERLLAVAYGCAMRSVDDQQIGALAQQIYDWLFSEGRPPAHMLLRDYARGVIEYALYRGLSIGGDVSKVRPPYESEWVEIPTKEEIDSLEVSDGSWDSPGGAWAQNWIIFSVMSWDFARYVIGTNSGHSDWLSQRLDEPPWESSQDRQEELLASLNPEQQQAWNAYTEACRARAARSQISLVSVSEDMLREILEEGGPASVEQVDPEAASLWPEADEEEIARLEKEVTLSEDRFLETLDAEKLETYKEQIRLHLNLSGMREVEPRFDMSQAQRWIVKRVFDLGWTQERFGLFDKWIGQRQREAAKPERIGKKYQWLAYHEILARISDNFQFRKEFSHHRDSRRYAGTWQLNVRDIDPSCVLRSEAVDDIAAPVWWVPSPYDTWDRLVHDLDWLGCDSDLPDPASLISVLDPQESTGWLAMYGLHKWQEPTSADEDHYASSRRDLFYLLQGYLVHRDDADEVYDWARQQDFYGRWMPEGRTLIGLYLGELYWSPAHKYYNDPDMGESGWRLARHRDGEEVPGPILPLSERYLAEQGTFDCSIDETYSIAVPAEQLIDGMALQWSGVDGSFFGRDGQLAALDPSVQEPGPEVLLVRQDRVLRFLEEEGYAVLWTLLGEKNLIGGNVRAGSWRGRLAISGAYRMVDGEVVGSLSTKFLPPSE